MKILIAFYSKSDNSRAMAQALKDAFESNAHDVKFSELKPKEERKAADYSKMDSIELEEEILDVKEFDLIVIGTPVQNFSPHPVVTSFLRRLQNTSNKKFGIFCSAVAMTGTTIKSLSAIISTLDAEVIGILTIKSLFDLDKPKVDEVKKFALDLMKKSA